MLYEWLTSIIQRHSRPTPTHLQQWNVYLRSLWRRGQFVGALWRREAFFLAASDWQCRSSSSSKTKPALVFLCLMALTIDLLIPKISGFLGFIVEHFCVKYDHPSCIGFWDIGRKNQKRQANAGENPTSHPTTAEGVGNKLSCMLALVLTTLFAASSALSVRHLRRANKVPVVDYCSSWLHEPVSRHRLSTAHA